jgi:hypothetical protein
MIGTRIGLAATALLLASCAAVGPPSAPAPPPSSAPPAQAPAPAPPGGAPQAGQPTRPALGLFSSIKAPDGVEPVLQLAGQGVQIFRCEARAGGYQWIFRQPDAQLTDAGGQALVHHGASYSFEHVDGSRLIGEIAAHQSPPSSDALPWLLLSTRSYGDGALAGVRYVQRIDTVGGLPPSKCEAAQVNMLLRVAFSANFVFYR